MHDQAAMAEMTKNNQGDPTTILKRIAGPSNEAILPLQLLRLVAQLIRVRFFAQCSQHLRMKAQQGLERMGVECFLLRLPRHLEGGTLQCLSLCQVLARPRRDWTIHACR